MEACFQLSRPPEVHPLSLGSTLTHQPNLLAVKSRKDARHRIRKAVCKKLAKIHEGHKPTTLDIFSGCGGITLGFHAAGFTTLGGVELDPWAASSFALNFASSEEQKRTFSLSRDITQTTPDEAANFFAPSSSTDLAFDVIVGGPPCQAFARVGRAKLREVAEDPLAFRQDPRGNLYLIYLQYVMQLAPVAILMENVPDVMNYGGHNIPEEVADVLNGLGYKVKYTLLNAAHFGVPQMRERMFLVAWHESIKEEFDFPLPTHELLLPRGYDGARRVALKNLAAKTDSETKNHYVECDKQSARRLKALTAKEAIDDLPPILAHLHSQTRTRFVNEFVPYTRKKKISNYANLMRSWPGFEGNGGVWDHITRSTPRDYSIFQRMQPGDQYPEALKVAEQLLEEKLLKEFGEKNVHYKIKNKFRQEMVPPYDPSKFPNKWRKLEPDMPARTLMAHLGKDAYSHIHYDSRQARTISVREAARLQSFPDGFRFYGSMNPTFRQIGNAVPPIMAKAIATSLMKLIQNSSYVH